MKLAFLALSLCVVASMAVVPDHLLNEWSQFKADEEFYDQMDTFLQTGTTDAGGDFEFKCETTCQLVQKNAAVPAARAAATNSLLQQDEGLKKMEDQIQDAFYKKVDSFLETESKTGDAGGDFEFKCETTCQLVQKNTAAEPATTGTASAARAAASNSAAAHAAAHNFLQTDAGLEAESQLKTESQLKAQATTAQAKDCYRLCLNPSMNPGCDVAANAVSLLETGTMTEEEMMRKNWSLGSGSGNCLNSCVHVCMAVHDSASS